MNYRFQGLQRLSRYKRPSFHAWLATLPNNDFTVTETVESAGVYGVVFETYDPLLVQLYVDKW